MNYLKKIKNLWISNSLIQGSVIYITGSILLKGTSFLLIPLYTRVFTPADYGTMELINTMMALLIILISFGFSQLIYIEYTHLLKENKVDYVKKINYSFNVLAIPLLIFIGLVLFAIEDKILTNSSPFILGVMVLIVYLSFFQNNIYTVFQLDQRPKLVTYNKAVVAVILLSLNILLIKYLKIGIIGVYISNLTAIVISLLLFKKESRHSGNYLGQSRASQEEVLNFVKLGFPFIITSLAYFGINGIDRFLIKSILGESDLGLYSLGFKFGSILEPLLITPILSAYNPFIFKRFSEKNFKLNVIRNSLIIVAIFFGIALVLPFFAKLVIDTKFHYSLRLIPIFVMGFAFLFLTQMFAAPLLYFKKKKQLVVNVVIASIINIILNFTFVKLLGVQGSALAFLSANVFWFFLTLYQVHRLKKSFNNLNTNIN